MGERSEANSFRKERPTKTHKTKSVTNTARCLLISCQGTPTRDGRAKRSQSLFKQKNCRRQQYTLQAQFSAFTFHLSPHIGMGEQSEANPEPKRKTTADEGYKRKAEQPPKVVADFLQRNTKQGWASEAKPIPTSKQTENKISYKHCQVFADFLPRNPNQGWASKAKPIPPEKKPTKTHKTKSVTNTARCLFANIQRQ